MNPNNTLNPNQLFTSKLHQAGLLTPKPSTTNSNIMEKKPSLIPAEKHPDTHDHDVLSNKHSESIKDHYKQQLQELKDRKHEASDSFTLFTGYEPDSKEGAVKGLSLALKNGTYQQAAEVMFDLIEYKIMCHAVKTFCNTYNLEDDVEEKQDEHKQS